MNTCTLIGRLTKAPTLNYIAKTGKPYASLTLAVDRQFKDKDGKKQADFFNIIVWGKQAENVANYTDKGSQVAIQGTIQNNTYTTNTGEKRYTTEIVADRVQFLSRANNAQNQDAIDTSDYKALEDEDAPF